MAEKLGVFEQMLWGKWAERSAINRNADDLDSVRSLVQAQGQEILRLRATIEGIVDVLDTRSPFADGEIERAIDRAWTKLSPPEREATDPYRGTPPADEPEAAKELLAAAQKLHFSKQFKQARAMYQQIVEQFPDTKAGTVAKQQVANLKNV